MERAALHTLAATTSSLLSVAVCQTLQPALAIIETDTGACSAILFSCRARILIILFKPGKRLERFVHSMVFTDASTIRIFDRF